MADGASGTASSSAEIVPAGQGDSVRVLVDVGLDEMIAKARSMAGSSGSDVTATNKLPGVDEDAMRLTRAGAIAPLYDPSWLAILAETSTVLPPVIRALQSNVDGHGFTLKPRVDFDDPKIRETVADAITTERVTGAGWKNPRLDLGELIPTKVEVDLMIATLQTRLRIEKARAEAFFSACCPGIGKGFTWLRKELRRDRLTTGSCYLGVRRNRFGEPAEFEHLPAIQMRLRPVVKCRTTGQPTTVAVEVPVRRTAITIDMVETRVAFRTFVQFGLTRTVFFKEYGDPRTVSAENGDVYDSPEHLPQGHREATEVVHLKDSSALSEYGSPLWIGASPPVTGLRASQEVNAQHFDSNAIPRMAVLVSGGTLKDGADKTLADAFKAHSKGRKNYGGLIVIQATPPGENPAARCTIELKPLKEAIPDDGLFLKYGAATRDEILSQFRLPKFVIGLLDDINKSTGEEGREFVENEVYQPLRAEFDEVMNSFLESMGVYGWKFVSNSPISRDPATMMAMVKQAAEAGGATVDDVRDIMGDVFNRRFPATADDLEFGKYPIALATLKIQAAVQAMGGGAGAGGPATVPNLSTTIGAASPQHADGRDHHAADAPAAKGKARPIAKTQGDLVRYLEGLRDAFDASATDAQAFEVHTAEGDLLVLPMSAAQIADLVTPDAP